MNKNYYYGYLNEFQSIGKQLDQIEGTQKKLSKRVDEFLKFMNDNSTALANYQGIQRDIVGYVESLPVHEPIRSDWLQPQLSKLKNLSSQISQAISTVKLLSTYKDAHGKQKGIVDTKDLTIYCKEKMTIKEIDNCLQNFKQQNRLLTQIRSKYDAEQQSFAQWISQLGKDPRIWKEDYRKISAYLKKVYPTIKKQDVDKTQLSSTLQRYGKQKASELSSFERSLGSSLQLYQKEINIFKTTSTSKADFHQLVNKIQQQEIQRKQQQSTFQAYQKVKVAGLVIGVLVIVSMIIYFLLK